MRHFILPTVLVVLAVAVRAQESRPTSAPTTQAQVKTKPKEEKLQCDPAAVLAYEKMVGALYRPRQNGLTAVQFQFLVKMALADGRKMEFGPYLVDWDAKTGHTIKIVGEWKKGMIKPEQMSANFLDEMLHDFIGWETDKLIKGRHLALGLAKQIIITLPQKEQSLTAIRRIVLAPNKAGLMASQKVLGEKDYPLMIREYDYVSGHKRSLVEHVRIKSGETRKVKTHTYAEVGGFTFPTKISSYGVEQGTREITYSSILVIKKTSK